MTAQEAKQEIITWRRQLEKLNQPIDAEAWDMAIEALERMEKDDEGAGNQGTKN